MSPLPPYWRNPEDEESAPLYKSDLESGFKDPNDESTYPVATAHGSSSTATYPPGLSDTGEPRSEVTYTFVPQWPVEGTTQDALGVLGHSKEVSKGSPFPLSYWSCTRIAHFVDVMTPIAGLSITSSRWMRFIS